MQDKSLQPITAPGPLTGRQMRESAELFRAMGAEREIKQAQAVIATIQDRRLGRFRTRSRRSDGLIVRDRRPDRRGRD